MASAEPCGTEATCQTIACRYCAAQIPAGSLKCRDCKSLLKLSWRTFTDHQILAALVTPASALVAAATFVVGAVWPNYSRLTVEPAGRNAGEKYYIVANRGTADGQIIRAATQVRFSPAFSRQHGLPAHQGRSDFIAAAPMETNLDLQYVKPGSRVLHAKLAEYKTDGKSDPHHHFGVLIDLIERKAVGFAQQGKTEVAEALLDLASYLVGVDDSKAEPAVADRLSRRFAFNVTFDFANYNGSKSDQILSMTSVDYAYWIANYASTTDVSSPLCSRVRRLKTKLQSLNAKLDGTGIYGGLCFSDDR